MSLSNFIKDILNIQDNNISFPEKDFYQIIQKDNLLIKVFKGFLNSNFCTCLYCTIQDDSLKRKLKLFWKSLLKYYPKLCQANYYCQSFKRKLSSKDKVDYLLEKIPELELNFNIYQDIIQTIRHNNFKRFENIVKKYLTTKEKISKKIMIVLKTLEKYMRYIENMFESNTINGLIEADIISISA